MTSTMAGRCLCVIGPQREPHLRPRSDGRVPPSPTADLRSGEATITGRYPRPPERIARTRTGDARTTANAWAQRPARWSLVKTVASMARLLLEPTNTETMAVTLVSRG
jgi:hypothetical protein